MLRFGKKGIIALLVTALMMVFTSEAMAEVRPVATSADLATAIAGGGEIQLTADITDGGEYVIDEGKTVTLDLNGKTLSRSSDVAANTFVIRVAGGNLTINDSLGGGVIRSTNNSDTAGRGRCIGIGTSSLSDGNGKGGSVVLNGGTLEGDLAHKGYGIAMYANSSKEYDTKQPIDVFLTIKDGSKIEAGGYGVAMFGLGCKLVVEGGNITAQSGFAISGSGNKWNGGTNITI
ncbi:MAG: hypothetical protein RR340_10860, partial [Cloacibacillus sp.]